MRGTITRRWILNNLVLVFLVLLVLDFAFMYAIQNYYYGASRQYLTTKATSVSSVLNRYAQDADTNFSSEMRSTIENFSDKDKMELMAINARAVSSSPPPASPRRRTPPCRTMSRRWRTAAATGWAR